MHSDLGVAGSDGSQAIHGLKQCLFRFWALISTLHAYNCFSERKCETPCGTGTRSF